jgi:hypothetical protein
MNKEEFEALQAKIQEDPDYFEKQLSKEDANLAKSKANGEAAKYRTERNELREKMAAIEAEKAEQEALLKQKEEEKLAKKGEFETLFNAQKAELDALKESFEGMKAENAKFVENENRLKDKLIEQLPEELRATFKDDSVEKIQSIIELTSNKMKPGNSETVTNPIDKSLEALTGKLSPDKFNAMSFEDQMAYAAEQTRKFKG